MVAVLENMTTNNVQIIEYHGQKHQFVKSLDNGRWFWWKVEHYQVEYSSLCRDRDFMMELLEAYYKTGYAESEMPLADFINKCVNDPP